MRRSALLITFILLAITVLAPAAEARDRGASGAPRVPGMTIVESTMSFEATWDALVGILEAHPNIGIVATLDHASNAATAGLELLPTREVFFGNPSLGTPIMQEAQTAGIDLPQKMLVWQDRRGRVFVGYNHPDYLAARHSAAEAPTLAAIEAALAAISGDAAGVEVEGTTRKARVFAKHPGLVLVESAHSADETFDRLVAAVEAAPPNILFTLEHDANAARAGLELDPTKLVVFGNPVLGTPLMQTSQTIGIDLPQKFLVIENAKGTYIVYNDPYAIARRHHVRGNVDVLDAIAGALANLAGAAAG